MKHPATENLVRLKGNVFVLSPSSSRFTLSRFLTFNGSLENNRQTSCYNASSRLSGYNFFRVKCRKKEYNRPIKINDQ